MDAETFRVGLGGGVGLAIDYREGPGSDLLLVLPGFWRGRHSSRIRRLGERLSALSPVAVVDMRGHGDSTGTYTFGRLEPGDIGVVFETLLARGHRRIGVIGLSLGGYIGMEAARNHRPANLEIMGAALIASPTEALRARPRPPSFDAWRRFRRSDSLRFPSFSLRALFRRRPNAAVGRPAFEQFPVAVFHGRRDWLIPEREAHEWKRGLGPRASVTIIDRGHRLHGDMLLDDDIGLLDLLESWWRSRLEDYGREASIQPPPQHTSPS